MAKKKINKKPFVIIFYLILIIGFGIYIYLNPFKEEKKDKDSKPNTEKKEPVVENFSFSFIGAGDALIHTGVYIDARTNQVGSDGYAIYDFNKMFTHVKEIIEPYDLKFYNQETIIGGK